MECAELKKLREQVHAIRKEMAGRRERARYMAEQSATQVQRDELNDLLERKLAHTVADIEQHVARHRCQD
jgi:hypothetical protein